VGLRGSKSQPGSRSLLDAGLLAAVLGSRAGIDAERHFRTLDARLRPGLLAYFRRHSVPGGDPEELVQATLARVYAGVKDLAQPQSFLGWLFVIARNVRLSALDEARRASRVACCAPESLDQLPAPETAAGHGEDLSAERLACVQAAIEALPSQQRQCLLLRARDDLSYQEIAAALALSVNTVRNHLAAARKALRRAMAAAGVEP
jgi:RNA polymerase sigma-70 factor (ECF subfamily)